MDFESKALGWVANLRDHFNTLCSEADALVPQEPIEFVRNQLITVGESLEQFCAELLQDSIGCLKKKRPLSHSALPEPCNTVEEVLCDPEKTGQIGSIAEDHFSPEPSDCKTPDNEVTSSTEAIHSWGLSEGEGAGDDYALAMKYLVETGLIGNFAEDHFAPEPGDCNTPHEEIDSSTEAIHSSVLSEGKEDGDSYVSELSGGLWFTWNHNGWQKLDESDDKFCSDFGIEKSNNHLMGTASAIELEKVEEDECGSDWEII